LIKCCYNPYNLFDLLTPCLASSWAAYVQPKLHHWLGINVFTENQSSNVPRNEKILIYFESSILTSQVDGDNIMSAAGQRVVYGERHPVSSIAGLRTDASLGRKRDPNHRERAAGYRSMLIRTFFASGQRIVRCH